MIIYYNSFRIEINFYEFNQQYYYEIFLYDSDFHFWDYSLYYYDDLAVCITAGKTATYQIISDYGFAPNYLQSNDSWFKQSDLFLTNF